MSTLWSDIVTRWTSPGVENEKHSHFEGPYKSYRKLAEDHQEMLIECLSGNLCQGKSVFELGPGGGVNIMATGMGATLYIGADINPHALERCGNVAASLGVPWWPVHIPLEPPGAFAGHSIVQGIEMFLCTNVIQHMPDRDYAQTCLVAMSGMAAPKAKALFHVRSDGPQSTGSYSSNWTRRVAMTAEEARPWLAATGWRVVKMVRPDYYFCEVA